MAGYDFPGPDQNDLKTGLNDGIVTADRSWSAELNVAKHIYQYVKFTDYDARNERLTMVNRYNFLNLNQFVLYYEVLQDGNVAESATLDLPDTAPGDTATITLPLSSTFRNATKETLLNVELRERRGYVYTVESTLTTLSDCGWMEIYLGCDPVATSCLMWQPPNLRTC